MASIERDGGWRSLPEHRPPTRCADRLQQVRSLVIFRSRAVRLRGLLWPRKRTSSAWLPRSVLRQNRKSLTSVAPSQAEHRSVAWLGGQASYWHIATRATAKTAHHDHVRPSRNRHLPEISRLSSILTQDRHVGRFAGFQSLPRVGGQGDGYQKLIAVIVAVCGYRL